MSANDNPIQNAIDALLKEGQTPSIAKIKARLSQPVPMRTLIQALQQWQRQPNAPLNVSEPPAETLSLEQRIATLEAQVAQLTQALSAAGITVDPTPSLTPNGSDHI